ncbi:MAG TPA: helicase-related protein, partial [Pseudonocardiaceae bacterium]|nr:helicase-related protein [Pseudonocardiaceae bacterium]
RNKYRLASENPAKDEVVARLLEHYPNSRVLIIGQYLKQLRQLSKRFKIPLITGQTGNPEREELYNRFRRGEIRQLILSKVGNFALDLPDANVLIQVSGTFGSRQEEAQRLGRLLRPKGNGRQAHFYSVVSRDTLDTDYAAHRQRFLAEQGYAYHIIDAEDLR